MDEYTKDRADELAEEYYQVNYNDSLGSRLSNRKKKAKELEEEKKAKAERIAKAKAATKERDKAAKAKASGDIEAAEKAEAEKAAAVAAKKESKAAAAKEAAKSAVNEAYEAVETARDNYWAIPIDVEEIEETRAALSESREAFVNAIKKLMPELRALEVLQNEEQYVQDIINNVQGFLRDLGVGAFLRGIDDAGLEELEAVLEEVMEEDIAEAEKAEAAKAIARALVLGQDLGEYVPLTPNTVHNTEDNGANLEQEESEAIARTAVWAEGLVEDGVHNGEGYAPLTPDNETVSVVVTGIDFDGVDMTAGRVSEFPDLLDEC